MHHWRALNILIPKKNFKLPLSRNLYSIPSQSFAKPTGGCFILSSQTKGHQKSTICFQHVKEHMLSKYHNLLRLMLTRNFSSTKPSFSLRGSNKAREDRKITILIASLALVVLLCIFLMSLIEYHQDHVIIEPDNEK